MDFFRILVSLFMAIYIPICGFFSSFKESGVDMSFTEPIITEKVKRDNGVFNPKEHDIFVSADALPNGDGSITAPFQTVYDAKEALKSFRDADNDDTVTVWIRGGRYNFSDTLHFTNDDAGNIIYRAYPDEKVMFSGAVALSGWTEETVNGVTAWSTPVPHGMSFSCVTKDGKTLPKTRYPESGYLTIEKEDHTDALYNEENTPWAYTYGDKAFLGNKNYNPSYFRNVENVCVRVLHYWVSDINYLTAYDASQNKYYTKYPFSMIVHTGDRYFFENIFEELNSPGEWYLDSENDKLYYIPFEDDDPSATVLNACTNKRLIVINSVSDIEFRSITFCDTNFTYPEVFDEGFSAAAGIKHPQAEYDVEGAVEITKAERINFTNCDFVNIGNTALKYNKEVKNSSVTGCSFRNIGANGVYIHGYNTDDESKITENITVADNLIESYGRNGYGAIGILITHARGCTLRNNEINDGYYTAISVGWVWGYGYSVTENNIIKDNLIYNIGQGWLSDMGGIYTLGIQNGTVISGNVIHDVAADEGEGGYGGWGIYLDEGSSYILVEKNLVYSCGSQSFNMHYGKENIVRNNIFALSKNGQVRSSFKEDHIQFRLIGNIILSDNSVSYARMIVPETFTDHGNICWDLTNGKYVVSSLSEDLKLEDRIYVPVAEKMGYFCGAVLEDPMFRDPRNFDFLIADNSEAVNRIGFERWNYKNAGTLTEF